MNLDGAFLEVDGASSCKDLVGFDLADSVFFDEDDLVGPLKRDHTCLADRVLWLEREGVSRIEAVDLSGLQPGEVLNDCWRVGLNPQISVVVQLLHVKEVVSRHEDV